MLIVILIELVRALGFGRVLRLGCMALLVLFFLLLAVSGLQTWVYLHETAVSHP